MAMSMRARLWNAHELATEFGLDYRIAARRLARIQPVELDGRSPLFGYQMPLAS
jgi:hypothetical protein